MIYRFDSGTPYSFVSPGYPITAIQASHDPGYAHPPTSQNLFFGERGAQTFPSQSRFDFALNYDIPIFKLLEPWLKVTVVNVFNTRYRTGFDTSIIPCNGSTVRQVRRAIVGSRVTAPPVRCGPGTRVRAGRVRSPPGG